MKNRRSSIVGSGLLDCIQWLRQRVNFLPLTSCQRKYSSCAALKNGRIWSNKSILTPVNARKEVGFFRALS